MKVEEVERYKEKRGRESGMNGRGWEGGGEVCGCGVSEEGRGKVGWWRVMKEGMREGVEVDGEVE